jgi:hypothetical protein
MFHNAQMQDGDCECFSYKGTKPTGPKRAHCQLFLSRRSRGLQLAKTMHVSKELIKYSNRADSVLLRKCFAVL